MNNRNILIIDKNPTFANSLQRLILEVAQNQSMVVDKAYNLIDGLKSLQEMYFETVFIDLDIPELHDFLPSISRIKSQVVGLTFFSDPIIIQQYKELGIVSVLSKTCIEAGQIQFALN